MLHWSVFRNWGVPVLPVVNCTQVDLGQYTRLRTSLALNLKKYKSLLCDLCVVNIENKKKLDTYSPGLHVFIFFAFLYGIYTREPSGMYHLLMSTQIQH